MVTISILIPAYNEERTIKQVLKTVSQQQIPNVEFEVVVVNDGSTDNTLKVLNENNKLLTKIITYEKNRGKGYAVIEGLKACDGQYILIQDADLEYSPEDYPSLLLPILKFEAEIVMGSRFLAPNYTRVFYFYHRLGNLILTLFFNILNNTTFTDIYTGYFLFKRDLVDPDELKCNGWDQQAEILTKIVIRAKSIYEVAINYRGRTYAEGKKIRAIAIIPVLWTVFKQRITR